MRKFSWLAADVVAHGVGLSQASCNQPAYYVLAAPTFARSPTAASASARVGLIGTDAAFFTAPNAPSAGYANCTFYDAAAAAS